MFRSIKPVAILIGATLVACSTTPGEPEILPDAGPTTREVYDRHLSGWIAPFGVPAPPATPTTPSNSEIW